MSFLLLSRERESRLHCSWNPIVKKRCSFSFVVARVLSFVLIFSLFIFFLIFFMFIDVFSNRRVLISFEYFILYIFCCCFWYCRLLALVINVTCSLRLVFFCLFPMLLHLFFVLFCFPFSLLCLFLFYSLLLAYIFFLHLNMFIFCSSGLF